MITAVSPRAQVSATAPAGWDDFVEGSQDGTIYHQTAWLNVIARCYGFRPYFITLTDANGQITGGLPLFLVSSRLTGRRLVSVPYTNAVGPVCRPGIDASPLLDAAVELARQESCRYVEVRDQPGRESLSYPAFERSDYFGTFLLELDPNVDKIRAQFDKRVRRGIAKAKKGEIQVRFGKDLKAIRAFYQLNLLTRRKHGVPPQPLKFFEMLWRELRHLGEIEVLLADSHEQTVAGLILLTYRDTVIYAYGASDQRFLRSAPNHALFDAAIRWSSEHGYSKFDFGRTSPDNEGLMEFKRQWGARCITLPYHYWPGRDGFVSESENGLKYRCFTALWRRLPLAATSILGPAIYRNLA